MARLVFFGNERMATGVTTANPTLKALIAAGHEIAAVVSNYEAGTSRSVRELEIKSVADEYGIPLLLPAKPADILEDLRNLGAEAAVLVAYGRIVPQSIIDIFPRGIINIHPSLLPMHRGPTPIESVIINGEAITGVSVMCLEAAMDAGPVYGQSELQLTGTETKQELADHLLQIGSVMVVELLPGILDGNIIAKPQDNEATTYDKLINKEDGRIVWNKTASQLEREIRAFAGWPKSFTTIANNEAIITKAHVSEGSGARSQGSVFKTESGELAVQTGNGLMIIDSLKPAGKNEMAAKDFLAGYGNKLT